MVEVNWRRALAVAGAACVIGVYAPAASGQDTGGKPDFSGVWTVYQPPGQSGFGGFGPAPELPLTEEGKRRREEYMTLVGATGAALEGDNPGAFCVTYGMPTMMEQAGFYPIEFIQRPIS